MIDAIRRLFPGGPEKSLRSGERSGVHSIASRNHPDNNEDRNAVEVGSRVQAILCDGISGTDGVHRGSEAAQIAVDAINQRLSSLPAIFKSAAEAKAALLRAFSIADSAVRQESRGSRQFGTTAVAGIKFTDQATKKDMVAVANCGDSRAYAITKAGEFRCITIDHSSAFEGIERERAKSLQQDLDNSKNPNQLLRQANLKGRNVISAFIGLGNADKTTDVYFLDPSENAYLLLVSDGVSDPLMFDQMSAIVKSALRAGKSPTELCQDLVAQAENSNSPRAKIDDRTALVLDLSAQMGKADNKRSQVDAQSSFPAEVQKPRKASLPPAGSARRALAGESESVSQLVTNARSLAELKVAIRSLLGKNHPDGGRIIGKLNDLQAGETVSSMQLDSLDKIVPGIKAKLNSLVGSQIIPHDVK